MLGRSIALVFRGLSIFRWNNFPRVEQVSVTDTRAYTLHVAFFLAKVLAEKENLHADIGYIFRRAVFSSFVTFVHSDISSDVQEHVRAKRPDISEALSDIVYETIAPWFPEKIRKDMEAHRRPKPGKELEENIYAFAKVWVSYREAMINDRVYFGAYSVPMARIRSKYLEPQFELFRKYLKLEEFQYAEAEFYLLAIRRLQSSFRWNLQSRKHPISVMSHSFIVTYLAYIIGVLERKTESEITDMMITGLFHDVPEAITGDVLTPTKKSVEGFEDLLSEIEVDMLEELLLEPLSQYTFLNELREKMLFPWKSENGPLVKIADIFSALFEAKIESENSRLFSEIFIRTKKRLSEFKFVSVDALFRLGVDYFDDDLGDALRFHKKPFAPHDASAQADEVSAHIPE